MATEQFNPDNVMLYEQKDGSIPQDFNELILTNVMDNSQVMKLGKYEQMDGQEKDFRFLTKGVGAYWVDEGKKIQTSKPEWATAKLRAKKLGVILVASREFLNYSVSRFFEEMYPQVAEAFYKKFDNAVILGVENPFAQSLKDSTEANKIEDALNYDTILQLEDVVADKNYTVNGFVSSAKNRSTLRTNAKKVENGFNEVLYDRTSNTLDGVPVADLNTDEMKKGTLYAGNFDYLRYGIPYPIHYSISEDAQLSTLTNEDGSPVNLFEQELIACRFTMDIGAMILSDDAFARIEAPASI